MAKGLRCKTKRAFRAVKRQHVEQTLEKVRIRSIQNNLELLEQGQDIGRFLCRPVNAFLHPDTPGAVFPQKEPNGAPLDFRSEKLPMAGLVGRHQRRRYTMSEKLELMNKYGCIPGRTAGPIVTEAQDAFLESLDLKSNAMECDLMQANIDLNDAEMQPLDEENLPQSTSQKMPIKVPICKNNLRSQQPKRIQHSARKRH